MTRSRHEATVAEVGEAAIVAWIRDNLSVAAPDDGVIVPAGDDAAVLAAAAPIVVTMDAISAGSDWLVTDVRPEDIGHRAVAVNLSDLAAMGATPRWLLLGLELAPEQPWRDLQAALHGALALARRHGARLVGGDVGIRPGPTTWTVTAIGEQRGRILRRNGARPGDRVWLVGALGLAALGLRGLQGDGRALPRALWERAETAHRRPMAQVAAGVALAAAEGIHAAIDVSDGLGLDAGRLADASGVSLALAIDALPGLDASTQATLDAAAIDWRRAVAAGGDDYALLVCAQDGVDIAALLAGIADDVQPIGRADAGRGVRLQLGGRDASALLGGFWHGTTGTELHAPTVSAKGSR